MDIKAVAKKIREAIFDKAESEGRVMHASSMDEVIEAVLTKSQPAPQWGYLVSAMDAERPEPTEYR